MKSTFILLSFLLFFSCGVTPSVQGPNSDAATSDLIEVRLGLTRRLKPGKEEFGVFRGRANGRISHLSGRDQKSYTTNWNGTINSKIDFKKDDKLYFESMWIDNPLIITNNLETGDNNLISEIHVAINEDDSTRLIYGIIKGLYDLSDSIKLKNTDIFIYADSVFAGHPDVRGHYAILTNTSGKVSLRIDIDKSRILLMSSDYINSGNDCNRTFCDTLTILERFNNDCCNTTITDLGIETDDNIRARIDIIYDDDQKKRMLLNKLNLMSLDDSLR